MFRFLSMVLLVLGSLAIFSWARFFDTQAQYADNAKIRGLQEKLHEAMPAKDQVSARDTLAKQQAEAALELLKLGRADQVWPLLRNSADPTLRTYIIHSLGRLNVDPAIIIRRLEIEKDVSARRALILSLGDFTGEQLSTPLRQSLIPRLLRWYRDDPDPGIHSAVDWLLRYGKQGNAPRKLDWQQTQAIVTIDKELTGRPPGKRNWYITSEGQTMVVIPGPAQFLMGSPAWEPGREPDEGQHEVRIPRSFAVASKEVTVGQYQRFLEANPTLEMKYPDPQKDPRRGSRAAQFYGWRDDCPQVFITWYEAAQYCNWLSKQEGIPESEWVYPARFEDIDSGMTLPKNYLHRTGYRMLTEPEWEYASRAGAATARFFGSSDEMLEEYAVYSKNPPKKKGDSNDPNDPQHVWLVGELKPNDFGLFDIYGNVWEWGHDRRSVYPTTGKIIPDTEDDILVVNDEQWRLRRGGSFTYEASFQRSAHRGRPDGYAPMERRDSVGFRVGRTYR
jgi:formylglycine-generating enzyme required for sulfatase activity